MPLPFIDLPVDFNEQERDGNEVAAQTAPLRTTYKIRKAAQNHAKHEWLLGMPYSSSPSALSYLEGRGCRTNRFKIELTTVENKLPTRR